MSEIKEFELKACITEEDLIPVHVIREEVLFKGRPYDRFHKDDRYSRNQNFVYLKEGKPVGIVRLDFLTAQEAAVRLVAILPEYQYLGIGKKMLEALEVYARDKSIQKLVTNAAVEAEGFYLKMGYELGAWVDPDDGMSVPTVSMTKHLSG